MTPHPHRLAEQPTVAIATEGLWPRSRAGGRGVGRAMAGGSCLILLLLTGWFSSTGMSTAWGETKPVNVFELKAAFLSKFPLFVSWPATSFASSNSPITIGVLGKTPVSPYLEAILRGKSVDNRRLQLRACDTVEEAANCHIVFIAESEKGSLEKILHQLEKQKILTVSDLPGFAERGGMLGMTEAGWKIRLEVNLAIIQNSGLRVDPQLLQIAKAVRVAAGKTNP